MSVNKIDFPLRLVDTFHSDTGTWQARRGLGTEAHKGEYRFAGNWQISADNVTDINVQLTLKHLQHALDRISRYLKNAPHDSALFANLTDADITLQIMSGLDCLITLEREAHVLYVSCEILNLLESTALSESSKKTGLECLFALGHVQLFLCYLGWTPPQALNQAIAFYLSFSEAEQDAIQQVLTSPVLDSGNVLTQFLQRLRYGSADNTALPTTWLLGQDRIDLPYSRAQALAIMATESPVDEQRAQLYRLLRGYDRALERGNIERIASEVHDAQQHLIFGRMSRAFHNQATLFANAVLVQPESTWHELAAELSVLTTHIPALQPSAGVLRQLLNSPDEIALIAFEGACERFEEAVLEEQKRALSAELVHSRLQIENHPDPLPAENHPTDYHAITNQALLCLTLTNRLRKTLLAAKQRHAAYVVMSQRPSPSGSHLLIKINEFQEPYLGKADNLRKLMRLAGDRIYSSPDYGWLAVADHWIEAIPLFIKEEVVVKDGQETTHTLIDISGMEVSFREEMADFWAINLRHVQESEWLSLARERFPELVHPSDIAAVALYIGELYRQHISAIQQLIETEVLTPLDALRQVILDHDLLSSLNNAVQTTGSWFNTVKLLLDAMGFKQDLAKAIHRLAPNALKPRRVLPTLHVLTTQSAGMTEGYIRTWLEESMALFNIVDDLDLHEKIAEREAFYATRLFHLGVKLCHELGIWVEIEESCVNEQLSQRAAVFRLINRNRQLQEELACLGALLEVTEYGQSSCQADDCNDPPTVDLYLQQHLDALQNEVLAQVLSRNASSVLSQWGEITVPPSAEMLHWVLQDEFLRQDLHAYMRFAARRHVLILSHPDRELSDCSDTYLRRFQQLSKTTARKAIIAESGLNHLSLHPQYYFQASGGSKRYHLIYTPSRVDLGQRERESVETWAQWIGGADRAAAQTGRQLYSLINKDVRIFDSLTEPEILKTGENASMASHFAFSNALGMMVTASAHGDFEAMADLMNLRHDRFIHPAGEGYGGYCVPKDGLFLEFVLTLSRAEKLRQMGLPERYHQDVLTLATALLNLKMEFATTLEWEQWAAEQLHQQIGLNDYFSVREGLPVFQITRIAHVLDKLGQPELRDSYRVAASLAAGWGLHKMVTGGEQVNRFMPFFKAWLIRQGILEAARRHPQLSIGIEKAIVVLTAEYKPDTQDARFATGLRKFEILAGTSQHLLNALDTEGRIVAVLMNEGFASIQQRGWQETLQARLLIDEYDNDAISKLHELFPPTQTPANIRLVSPTGLSTQDILNYTSDTQLEAIADATRKELLAAGLTDKEIEANLSTWGIALSQWDHRVDLSPLAKKQLHDRLAGHLHVLALANLGPERDYHYAVQGADVIDTGIPHQSLLTLLANPAQLCQSMLAGNPNSALVIADGAAGARHRAMNKNEVKLWFAVGDNISRESVYLCVGIGHETIENWRLEMRRQRRSAEQLLHTLTSARPEQALRVYEQLLDSLRHDQDIQATLSETEKLNRFRRGSPRDRLCAERLDRIGGGLALKELHFVDFLALGGIYLLMGASADEQQRVKAAFTLGLQQLGASPQQDDESLLEILLPTPAATQKTPFQQEKGIESSNKAMEERPTVALETRRQLAARIAQAQALNQRQAGFAKIATADEHFSHHYQHAMQTLGDGHHTITEACFGSFLKHTRNALSALVHEYLTDAQSDARQRVEQLYQGRQLNEAIYQQIAGGYEDIGDFGRMAQQLREHVRQGKNDEHMQQQGLQQIAQGAELFYISLAIDSTLGLTQESADPLAIWRALASFFAKTLNDHSYEYRPWVYSRGTGYLDFQAEALYQLAVERHRWLYRYLRFIVTQHTELRELPRTEQDLLIGNDLNDKTLEAIGAGAAGRAEKSWRAYGQLRELAFIRNDGFALPIVFAEFDPALIDADHRVNHVIVAPVGRTHFSRALAEGPCLAKQLIAEGRAGANLIITRYARCTQQPDLLHPVVSINSGHLYVDASTYAAALIQHKGYSQAEATVLARHLHPKGIRIAAQFTRPIIAALVYPFHGDPLYDSGQLEACGLPYTVQSLFHSWTTYDKAKYQDIFQQTEVELPDEIAWFSQNTVRSHDKMQVKTWLREGLPDVNFPGLEAFAQRHPLVMIKDASESGGRNAQAFSLQAQDGRLDTTQIALAIDFIYQISLKHHVCIQEVIVSSPEHWATEAFMRQFVHRQIIEWGGAVNRQRQPFTPLFGSHRIIVSTDNPHESDLEKKWHSSHWLTLNSRQLITNVGRGGILEQLHPEWIRPEYRATILNKLAYAGRQVMEALAAYEARCAEQYTLETGRQIGKDLLGVSYGFPRYLMLDFLIAPIVNQDGHCIDWRVVLIEPNVGVGLWDRVALREAYHEQERAQTLGVTPDWDNVGINSRIVLRDLNRAGEQYLGALKGNDVNLS